MVVPRKDFTLTVFIRDRQTGQLITRVISLKRGPFLILRVILILIWYLLTGR